MDASDSRLPLVLGFVWANARFAFGWRVRSMSMEEVVHGCVPLFVFVPPPLSLVSCPACKFTRARFFFFFSLTVAR